MFYNKTCSGSTRFACLPKKQKGWTRHIVEKWVVYLQVTFFATVVSVCTSWHICSAHIEHFMFLQCFTTRVVHDLRISLVCIQKTKFGTGTYSGNGLSTCKSPFLPMSSANKFYNSSIRKNIRAGIEIEVVGSKRMFYNKTCSGSTHFGCLPIKQNISNRHIVEKWVVYLQVTFFATVVSVCTSWHICSAHIEHFMFLQCFTTRVVHDLRISLVCIQKTKFGTGTYSGNGLSTCKSPFLPMSSANKIYNILQQFYQDRIFVLE